MYPTYVYIGQGFSFGKGKKLFKGQKNGHFWAFLGIFAKIGKSWAIFLQDEKRKEGAKVQGKTVGGPTL